MTFDKEMDDRLTQLLQKHKLRNTSVRKEVLSLFIKEDRALSSRDIENILQEIDRITLYRTLKAFQEKGLVHKATDGTDVSRYALCDDCNVKEHFHEHAHLHCDECNNTYCLEELSPPDLKKVKGVKIREVELVVKGVCADCVNALR